jgi:hypothetical protein
MFVCLPMPMPMPMSPSFVYIHRQMRQATYLNDLFARSLSTQRTVMRKGYGASVRATSRTPMAAIRELLNCGRVPRRMGKATQLSPADYLTLAQMCRCNTSVAAIMYATFPDNYYIRQVGPSPEACKSWTVDPAENVLIFLILIAPEIIVQ